MRPVRQLLNSDPALADWIARREGELRLTSFVRSTLPASLAARVSVADARLPDLVLAVSSGAFAALVRQRGPEILAQLSREGWKFTSIRVRMQVDTGPEKNSQFKQKQIDKTSARALQALVGRLDEGALQQALRRLIRAAGGDSED